MWLILVARLCLTTNLANLSAKNKGNWVFLHDVIFLINPNHSKLMLGFKRQKGNSSHNLIIHFEEF